MTTPPVIIAVRRRKMREYEDAAKRLIPELIRRLDGRIGWSTGA
jgi:hypothetical protein